MRFVRLILIFLAGLVICGLIAVSLAVGLRAPQGPDLGVPDYEYTETELNVETQLWYSASILGRWSEDGRCNSSEETWVFARRRVIRPEAICEISAFIPTETRAIDLYRCEAGVIKGDESAVDDMQGRMELALQSDTHLLVLADKTVDLRRCQ